MTIEHEEAPAGLQALRDDARPAFQVRQPRQRADRREHDVELPLQARRGVVHVAADEIGGQRQFRGQFACLGDGGFHEIHAGDDGAVPRPRQRVEAEVALQVQQRLAA